MRYFGRGEAEDTFSDAAVAARTAKCPEQRVADAYAVFTDLAIGTTGIAFRCFLFFAFSVIAVLAIGTFVTVFAGFWGIIFEKAVRADTDGASPIDAFFSLRAIGIARNLRLLFFAHLIDADFIVCALCARIG